jgi:hypothetical protein
MNIVRIWESFRKSSSEILQNISLEICERNHFMIDRCFNHYHLSLNSWWRVRGTWSLRGQEEEVYWLCFLMSLILFSCNFNVFESITYDPINIMKCYSQSHIVLFWAKHLSLQKNLLFFYGNCVGNRLDICLNSFKKMILVYKNSKKKEGMEQRN